MYPGKGTVVLIRPTQTFYERINIAGRVTALLGIFDSLTWYYPAKSQFYHVVFQVEAEGNPGSQRFNDDVGFFPEEEVGKLSSGFHLIVPKLFELHRRKIDPPHFDIEGKADPPAPPTLVGATEPGRPGHDVLRSAVKEIANELSEVGAAGLGDLEHAYAKHNYELMESASSRLEDTLKLLPPGEAFLPYEDNIGHESRRMAALAAVFRDGQLLLIRREDSGLWALPGGMTDVGETWAHCAQRELWEETSVKGRVVELLAIFDWRLLRNPPRPLLLATFLVESDNSSKPRAMPETLGAGFFPVSELPELSPGYERLVPMTIALFQGQIPRPHVHLPLA